MARKLFDTHVHCFPDKLEGKVLPGLSQISDTPYYGSGTLSDTAAKLHQAGCDGFLLLHIATNPRQEHSVNGFAIECQQAGYLSFGSVHPLSPNRLDELRRIGEAGLRGVKFHPDYQDFFVDDPNMEEVYALCDHLGLTVAFHTGFDPYSPQVVHCRPQALSRVAEAFPNLKIIAAHMGGMKVPEEAKQYLAGRKNVYFDTAFASNTHTPDSLEELIRAHGVSRVLFATDFPWSLTQTELELLESTHLTESEKDAVCWGNAAALLGLA